MNVRAMHIEIEQSMQQVAAARTRGWEPEELDWVLNKQQDRLILSCLKPKPGGGFEIDQAGVDKIRPLVKSKVPLSAYVESTTSYKAFLPADYMYLLSDESLVNNLCGAAITTESVTQRITRLLQAYTTKSSAPFYVTMTVAMPNASVVIPTDLPYGYDYAGLQQKPDVTTFLVPWILSKNKSLYWEKFDDLYYPGHYVQVQETAPSAAVLTMDATITTTTGVVTRTLTKHTNTGLATANRLTASPKIAELSGTPFYKTAYYSPISELENRILRVYSDSSFTVSGLVVSYVRKPQPISLSLNTSSEIDDNYHQALCDLCVEYLKGRVENQTAKKLVTEDIEERVIL